MRHTEFFDAKHFENNYHRVTPSKPLSDFIDFFWQTRFENLWEQHPHGFSDYLFPNTGYSYLVNAGTPFTMQIGEHSYPVRNDSFLPRHASIECHHQKDNLLFGIKFRISPVVFEKKVNFSEYKKSMTPLSYLIDKEVVQALKENISFKERVKIAEEYFIPMISKEEKFHPVKIVSSILERCIHENNFSLKIEDLAREYSIVTRTLQRYFEQYTSLGCKETLQILRSRKCLEKFSKGMAVNLNSSGFYDYSHFYKYMMQFLGKDYIKMLVERLQKQDGNLKIKEAG